jgi:hypothetical protein
MPAAVTSYFKTITWADNKFFARTSNQCVTVYSSDGGTTWEVAGTDPSINRGAGGFAWDGARLLAAIYDSLYAWAP